MTEGFIARLAAAEIGAQRFLALVRKYGLETVNGAYEDLMDYSERLMRAAIRDLPEVQSKGDGLLAELKAAGIV